MVEAFGVVIFVVVIGATIVGIWTLAGARRSYDEIGKGAMSLNDGTDRPADEPTPGGAAASAIRDDEIRQMLEARSARRVRKGEAPLDIEAELARLTAPAPAGAVDADAGLLDEVRQLVDARNARRIRAGKEPLDVEVEVARRLAALEEG